jgi:epoxyqueuosine reductase
MKLVVHTCCASCLAATLDEFARLGEIVAYFHNPNIHPLLEFRKRLKAFEVLAEREKFAAHADREYGLTQFLAMVPPDGAGRCEKCYAERLGATARFAAEQGADAFTSTLVASTHQDHDAIRRAGEAAAAETGVEFVYRDLRHCAKRGHELARKMSLYRQQYCGCIFSEYERYKDTHVDIHPRPKS